ncbi:MAG: thiamine-phosphate kinase [Nitrosopumilus sp. D6]|nr:MAG: thiamine-phosphate kinase [Nitrosopumilus sp. D6]
MHVPDEQEIVRIFQKKLRIKSREDVETFEIGNIGMVASTDTLVFDTDVPPGMSPRNAAAKSVTACASDFAAKGIRPSHGIISVSLPRGTTSSYARQMALGVGQACSRYKIRMLGGDTNEGAASITVCLFGRADSVIPRNGAKSGDAVFVTGPFGYAAAGLDALMRGGRKFARYVLSPEARLEFGVKSRRFISASMDSSDGLAATLHEIARQSKKRMLISKIPVRRDVIRYSESRHVDSDRFVFYGGEEYEIVFTSPLHHRRAIMSWAKKLKVPIIQIGMVAAGSGVYLKRDNGMVPLADDGWQHFKCAQ